MFQIQTPKFKIDFDFFFIILFLEFKAQNKKANFDIFFKKYCYKEFQKRVTINL